MKRVVVIAGGRMDPKTGLIYGLPPTRAMEELRDAMIGAGLNEDCEFPRPSPAAPLGEFALDPWCHCAEDWTDGARYCEQCRKPRQGAAQ